MKKPRGWTKNEAMWQAYEESGRAIGKRLLWDKSAEPKIWSLIAGTDIWPRWYLMAFRYCYIQENPLENMRWKNYRRHRKAKLLRQHARMSECQEGARETLRSKQTRKDAGPET